MLVPRRLGGAEADLAEHLQLLRELASADGSVGWTVMIGSSAPMLLGKLPPATSTWCTPMVPTWWLPERSTRPVRPPSSTAASGRAVVGRSPAGAEHADWFLAHCMVDDGSMPPLRMMVLPASDVHIVDTWTVSGLCGTGSHDFVARRGVRARRPHVHRVPARRRSRAPWAGSPS